MEQLSLDEFNKKYNQPKENWDFDLFKIVCVKCGSFNVEYCGSIEEEGGWYGDYTIFNNVIIKCHSCGNAIALQKKESGRCNSYGEGCDGDY